MASKTSGKSIIKRKRPGAMGSSYDEEAYYQTTVTTLADGSVMTETYRTDANGNNQVKIQETTAGPPPGGGVSTGILSTATDEERKELADPDSQLRKEIKHQTESVKQDLIDNNVDGVTPDTVDKAGGGSGNNENTNGGDGGDADTPTDAKPGSGLSDVQQRTDYEEQLRYPEDINTTYQDFLKIMMVEYTPRGLSPQQGGLGIKPRGNLESVLSDDTAGGRNILSNIYLAIPDGIKDDNIVDWGSDKVDPLKSAAAALASGFLGEGTEGVTEAVKEIAGGVNNQKEGVKEAVKGGLTESITGVAALKREQGAILNNNLELLFNGPQLRSFNFTFNFSARNKEEGQMIMKIIRTLKQGMSAKKSNGFLFIKSPHTFFLGYYKGGTDRLHPYLNKFKECALTQLSVNYAPAKYSTYVDGLPTKYQITMGFKELEPVFDDDYGEGYTDIGF